LLCLAGGTWLFHERIFFAAGAVLINSAEPFSADAIVVLSGDYSGNRVLKAVELARAGFAPRILVDSGDLILGAYEGDLAMQFAARHGAPLQLMESLTFEAHSTVEEVRKLAPELKSRCVRRCLVVTSDFHTARASRIIRREAPWLNFQMVAAPSPAWNGGYWWKTREGRKTWLLEASKTIADFLGW
jgi:uncharacterized SAM-binding protein YcdF (DUF218 family)